MEQVEYLWKIVSVIIILMGIFINKNIVHHKGNLKKNISFYCFFVKYKFKHNTGF
jgi:hypothetical protein